MSSINQLVSEIAHNYGQADNLPARRAIKLAIIHARNTLIRQSYTNHGYIDKGLQQRIKLSLIDINDGDMHFDDDVEITLKKIKRTTQKVPRPVRLTNNLPFQSVRTAGVINPIEIPFVKEATSKFYSQLPGMCHTITYDYINEYIYLNLSNNNLFNQLGFIIVESVFEYPQLINIETSQGVEDLSDDDNEFLLPEDMIEAVKAFIKEHFTFEQYKDTNEISKINLVK